MTETQEDIKEMIEDIKEQQENDMNNLENKISSMMEEFKNDIILTMENKMKELIKKQIKK